MEWYSSKTTLYYKGEALTSFGDKTLNLPIAILSFKKKYLYEFIMFVKW